MSAPEFQIKFEVAERSKVKAKIGFFGPSSSGKTLAMLLAGKQIQDTIDPTKQFAVIDSEHRRCELYSAEPEFLREDGSCCFRVYNLVAPYSPGHYIAAIQKAEALGSQVLGIDSISHEWFSKGGVQEIVDEAAARQFGKNQWSGWSVGTPLHNQFLEAILGSQMHVVCTMRAKTEWIQEGGKPKKVGLGPVQRDNIEYEFDVCVRLEPDHSGSVVVSRSRTEIPPGTELSPDETGAVLAERVITWLDQGVDRGAPMAATDTPSGNGAAPAEGEGTEGAPAAAEAAGGGEDPPITSATKGQVTKALNSLNSFHGDWEGGTDWAARLKEKLPSQPWNTGKVATVEELTEGQGQALLRTIAETGKIVAEKKLEKEKADAAAAAEAGDGAAEAEEPPASALV